MQITSRLAVGLAIVVALTTSTACAASAPQLAGREFLSVGVTDGGAAKPLVAGTRIRLDFQAESVGASAGCNSMGGAYRIESGVLIVDSIFMTEMACDEARMAQDEWLSKLLGSKPSIRIVGDELTLQSGSIVVRLLDRKIVEPDAALTGPTWTVQSIITGDSVSSIPGGVVATLVFKADGTVTVAPGCNDGTARWVAVGGGIKITELGLTKKACPGPAGELETAVIAVLGAETLAASIKSNVLTLQAGQRGLQLRGG